MFKDFAVNKRAFSKMVYQILSIVIKININKVKFITQLHPHGTFLNIILHISLNTPYHFHLKYINYYCNTVINYCVTVNCAEVFVAMMQRISFLNSFSEERCTIQVGALTSTILCKCIIYYQILMVQSRKLKKLQRDDRFNMENKS